MDAMKRMEELQQEMLAMTQSGNIDQVRYMEIATEMQSLAILVQQQQMERLMVDQQEQHRQMMRDMGHEPDAEDEADFQAMLEKQKEDFMRPAGASYAASQAMMQDTQLMDHMMQNAEEMNAQLMSLFSDDDDGMTEEEAAAFIAQNAPPPQYARLMPIGALLIGTHDEPYQTLALIQDTDYTESVLEGGWGIESREEGIEMLESLLNGRHAGVFDEDFLAIKNGETDDIDEDDLEDYEATVEGIVELLELPQDLVDNCKTVLAWDLERIGYLARLFVNIGYLTQDEAWEWMEKAAKQIKATFGSWEEYIVSLLIGRGFAMGVHREPFAVAYDLLTDSREFLDAHPISAL